MQKDQDGALETRQDRFSLKCILLRAWGPLISIALALIIGAIMMWAIEIDPLRAYKHLILGSFGTRYVIGETLTRTCPLLLAALGFAFGAKCGVFNIGAEGQIYIGALGAALLGIAFPGLPAPLHITLALIAAFAFGGGWGMIAGALKAWLGVSEIISTIMFNYIATLFVTYLVNGPIKDPSGTVPQTVPLAASARLPVIFPGTRLHAGILVALLVAFLIHYILKNTTLGFQVKTVGLNSEAARYAGINVAVNSLIAMLIAGGAAGLGGAVEVMGTQGRLVSGFSPGYGYDAIGVAILGRTDPFGIVFASILFGALRAGAGSMQRNAGVPVPIVSVIQGLIIFFIVASTVFDFSRSRLSKDSLGKEGAKC